MEAPVNRFPVQHGTTSASALSNSRSHTASCSVLERFASLLGSKGPHQDIVASSARMKELTSLLSPTATDDDVVLTVPSLDLRLTEGEKGLNGMLPEVGSHAATDTKDSMDTSSGESRPNMVASVLSLAPAAANQDVIELKAAQNIGKRTSWTRSTVGYASGAVGVNISDSFTTLLNSRLRAWTLLLLRHSLSTGSGESRTRLLSMLAADIAVKSIETDYKTLPLPEAAKGAKPKDSDVILPLLFQVTLHVMIQNQPENVTLRAPGTIAAIFDSGTGLKRVNVQLDTRVVLKSMLDQARIAVMKAVASATDSTVPAISEMSRTATATHKPGGAGTSLDTTFPIREHSPMTNSELLLSKRSTLSLSSSGNNAEEANRLKKARTSALRLNSVLHGGGSLNGRSSSGVRSSINLTRSSSNNNPVVSGSIPQVRSVRFDHLILRAPKLTSELTPTPNPDKLVRTAQTANKLKSYKSFGRPHAGDFGTGPRNATFGEFGHAGAWGRDGRLAAHPMPGQANPFDAMMEESAHSGGASSTHSGGVDRNATFDTFSMGRSPSRSRMMSPQSNPFLRPDGMGGLSSAAASGATLLNRSTTSGGGSGAMPRTATALESLMMKNWT